MHFRARVQHDLDGPVFMRAPVRRFFEQMRKGAVTDVVEQRCRHRIARPFRRQTLPERQSFVNLSEPAHEARHHKRGAHGVREPSVIGAWIRKRREAELADASQALHLRGVDEPRHDRVLVGFERDEPMHGVS